MSNLPESGWVPDKLPNLKQREFRFVLKDSSVIAGVNNLAKKYRVKPIRIVRDFIRIGLLTDRNGIVVRDRFGLVERPISLMDEDFGPTEVKQGESLIAIERTIGIKNVLSSLGDSFMEIANKHNITVEELFERVIRLGLKVTKKQDSLDDSTYILKTSNGDVDFRDIGWSK